MKTPQLFFPSFLLLMPKRFRSRSKGRKAKRSKSAPSRKSPAVYKRFLCDQALERKKIDLAIEAVTLTTVNASGVAIVAQSETQAVTDYNLCRVAQGQTALTRDGDRIFIPKMEFRLWLEYIGNSLSFTRIDEMVRFVVVRKKNTNGAAPVWADVFDADLATTVADPTLRLFDQPVVQRKRNFDILYDKTVRIPAAPAVWNTVSGTFYVPDQNIPHSFTLYPKVKTIFNEAATGGLVADVYENGIFLFAKRLGDQSSTTMYLNGQIRVHYVG